MLVFAYNLLYYKLLIHVKSNKNIGTLLALAVPGVSLSPYMPHHTHQTPLSQIYDVYILLRILVFTVNKH